jgi:hypothetical protein
MPDMTHPFFHLRRVRSKSLVYEIRIVPATPTELSEHQATKSRLREQKKELDAARARGERTAAPEEVFHDFDQEHYNEKANRPEGGISWAPV